MKCEKCGHDDYTIHNTTGGPTSDATVTFTITVPVIATQTNTSPTFQFHFDCECCENNHKDTRAHVVG